jgi:cytidine deaminase
MLLFLGILVLIIIITICICIVNNSSQSQCKSCILKTQYNNVEKHFENSSKPRHYISAEDFKNIVSESKSDIDNALLAIANFIAFKGITVDSTGQRIPKHSGSPAAIHTVISKYPVGACVLTDDGTVYLGANFEFFSPLINTIHGEQCAVHNAAIHGAKKITKLAVNAAPCGVCRQYLVEIDSPKDLDIIFCNNAGCRVSKTLEELLIENFGPENLGVTSTALNHPINNGTIATNTTDKYVNMALDNWKNAYAPYSQNPSSVLLVFDDKTTVGGICVENAAYNPSISALRGALSLAALQGKDFSKVTDIYILVTDTKNVCNAPKFGDNECINQVDYAQLNIEIGLANIMKNARQHQVKVSKSSNGVKLEEIITTEDVLPL